MLTPPSSRVKTAGTTRANCKELGLEAEPNVGGNGRHASASPFEGLAEKDALGLLQRLQHHEPRGSSNREGWRFYRVCVERKDPARLFVGAQGKGCAVLWPRVPIS